jgi:hypothetical protein
MKAIQAVFETNVEAEAVRLTFVPFTGVNAEVGVIEDGVFVALRSEDQFLFTDHPELRRMYGATGWHMETVAEFVFGVTGADDAKQMAEFNRQMNSL